MPVLYNNQTIQLPFDISKLDNLYQPYRYTEYNVCDDTCESDLNDHFAQIFPDLNTIRQMNLIRATETLNVYPVNLLYI